MASARNTTVAVIGGGVAGSSVALSLARAGVATAVVSRSAARTCEVGETLPPSARLPLEGLGLWERFTAAGHEPSHGTRSLWGDAVAAERDFIFEPYGPGWHLDRGRFDAMLAGAAAGAGVAWYDAAVTACKADGRWRLVLDGVPDLLADVVVDATGRACRFARRLGATRRVFDRMVAVAAVLAMPAGCNDRATLVEAVEGGWWYSAALPGDRLIAVYVTDPADADVAACRTLAGFTAQVHQAGHTGARAQGARLLGPPRVTSASSAWLDAAARRERSGLGWAAVGDAAACHDPLAARGIVAAMLSGRAAALAVLDHLGGDREALGRYAGSTRVPYARYLIERCGYYRMEQRWPQSPFWQKRWQLPTLKQGG